MAQIIRQKCSKLSNLLLFCLDTAGTRRRFRGYRTKAGGGLDIFVVDSKSDDKIGCFLSADRSADSSTRVIRCDRRTFGWASILLVLVPAACRVSEGVHRQEIKYVSDEGVWEGPI